MKPTLNFKKKWKATTAVCIVSTMAVATAAFAAGNGGLSTWDTRSHPNPYLNGGAATAGVANSNLVTLNKSGGSNSADSVRTASPIKHVIILIGENRGLDHTFGVYKPKGKNQTISNLLSKGIVNEDGTPGPNFSQAQQYSVAAQSAYYIGAPAASKSPYGGANIMPQPNTNGAPSAQSATGAPFQNTQQASVEKDIDPSNLDILTTGFTGLPKGVLDTRIPNAGTLSGPFPLQGQDITDDDYTGDMTHRFYQDWQQDDCSVANVTKGNTSGCLNDLFPFVMATYSNGNSRATKWASTMPSRVKPRS